MKNGHRLTSIANTCFGRDFLKAKGIFLKLFICVYMLKKQTVIINQYLNSKTKREMKEIEGEFLTLVELRHSGEDLDHQQLTQSSNLNQIPSDPIATNQIPPNHVATNQTLCPQLNHQQSNQSSQIGSP